MGIEPISSNSRPEERKTGKKTSQKSSRDGKSGLVFFSKSPPIGLVRNLQGSLVVFLTTLLTGVILFVKTSFFLKKD